MSLTPCEVCGTVPEVKYGSGRFCCMPCSKRYSALMQAKKKKIAQEVPFRSDDAPLTGAALLSALAKHELSPEFRGIIPDDPIIPVTTTKETTLGRGIADIEVKPSPVIDGFINRRQINSENKTVNQASPTHSTPTGDYERLTKIAQGHFERATDIDQGTLDRLIRILNSPNIIRAVAKCRQKGHELESAIRMTFANAVREATDPVYAENLKTVKFKLCGLLKTRSDAQTLRQETHKNNMQSGVNANDSSSREEITTPIRTNVVEKYTVRYMGRTREQLLKFNERDMDERIKLFEKLFMPQFTLWA